MFSRWNPPSEGRLEYMACESGSGIVPCAGGNRDDVPGSMRYAIAAGAIEGGCLPALPTDPPEAEGRRWVVAWPPPQPRVIGGWGRAVGVGPPQPPWPIPARPGWHHWRRSPAPSAWTAKGAAAASARTHVAHSHEDSNAGNASQVQKYRHKSQGH